MWPATTAPIDYNSSSTTTSTTNTTSTTTTTTSAITNLTQAPTEPTAAPTEFPTSVPTHKPSIAPTNFPTFLPTATPTSSPTPMPKAIVPCAPLCERAPIESCKDDMLPAGGTCEALTTSSPCIEEATITVRCPGSNTNPFSQPILKRRDGGSIRVIKCQVCQLGLVADTDSDPKRNRISASIQFGPNMVSGVMNEVGIEKYSIFLTDVYGKRLLDGEAVKNVTNTHEANGTDCCDPKAYITKVSTWTPINDTEFRFEVAPVTDGAKEALPNGLL